MKKILLILSLFPILVFSQKSYKIPADSTILNNIGSGKNELVIRNATSNITGGVLTNLGNGVTAFVLGGNSARVVDTIYKNSAKDSIVFTISGIRYAVKDSIGVTDLTSYALQSSLNDTASTLRRIRKVDSSYLFKNATRDSICMVTVINGNSYRTCAFDSSTINTDSQSLQLFFTDSIHLGITRGNYIKFAYAVDSVGLNAGGDSIVVIKAGLRLAYKIGGGGGGGGGGGALSSLTAATATNIINNGNYKQEWQWNSLTSGVGLKLSSNSTGAASNTQTVFQIAQSGANASGTQTTYGADFSNIKTGTSSTNVGLRLMASGATNNYALVTTAGRVGINTATPSALMEINTGNGGYTNGLHLTQTSNNSNTDISYNAIQFNVPTTGNIGSLTATASNYYWTGFNLLPNSIALSSYASNSQLGLFAEANSFITFNTNGFTSATERMRITSAGNVGIGTNSPAVKLDVYNGRIRTTNTTSSGNGSTAYELYAHNGSSVVLSGLIYSTNSTFSFGTSLANQTSIVGNQSGGVRLATVVAPIIFSNGNPDIDLAIERMRITSSGNIGIGTNSPAASSILELSSTTQGFLPPRMTATQASAISSPAQGLLLFVSDTNGTFTSVGWWGYNGATWEKLNN